VGGLISNTKVKRIPNAGPSKNISKKHFNRDIAIPLLEASLLNKEWFFY